MDNEIIYGQAVEIAEYDGYKLATFLISVLDEYDLNGRMIPKSAAEACCSTIIGFPVVAKLVCNPITGEPMDFAGHEMKLIIDENGNKSVRFETQPIGSVLNCWIEQRLLPGGSTKKDCIMISTKLWKSRYPEYIKVLDDLWSKGKVSSSWELVPSSVTTNDKGKIIEAFTFIGNCILGTSVQGAVQNAGIIEYAEIDEDVTNEFSLASALSIDVFNDKKKEDVNLENIDTVKNDVLEDSKEKEKLPCDDPEDNTDNDVDDDDDDDDDDKKDEAAKKRKKCGASVEPSGSVEGSSITIWDLQRKLDDAVIEKLSTVMGRYVWAYVCYVFPKEQKCWAKCDCSDMSELDYYEFTYTVGDDDSVTVSDPVKGSLVINIAEINDTIAEKNSALVSANEKIVELTQQIAELAPYKAEHDRVENEKIEAANAQKRAVLKANLEKSKLFSKKELASEDVSTLIQNIDEHGVNNIIAQKYIASLEGNVKTIPDENKPEVASIGADINTADDEINVVTYISKNYKH